MNVSSEQKVIIAEIVEKHCKILAKAFWPARWEEAIAPVFEKVIDNLQDIDHLEKSLEYYVERTARLDSRRYYLREKNSRLVMAGVERQAPGARNVLDWLIQQEDQTKIRSVLHQLPQESLIALLVHAKAQELDGSVADLPKSMTDLAQKSGRSRQYCYNLVHEAKRFVKRQFRQEGETRW